MVENGKSVRIDKDLAKNDYVDILERGQSQQSYKLWPRGIIHNHSSAIDITGQLWYDNDIRTFKIIGQRIVNLPFKRVYKSDTDYSGHEIHIVGVPTA